MNQTVVAPPYARLQSWINGNVVARIKDNYNDFAEGTLLSVDFEGVIIQGQIFRISTKETRIADVFVPWESILSLSFTADATEPRPSTFPAYTPGQDNWTGER